ncbi:MAG: glycosyltransferase [Candidatus Omnitrophota bacterium]
MPSPTPTCRLVVLQYNRRDLLERFLPSVVKAANLSSYHCEVTVLDNQSSDDSVDYVRKNFPQVEIYIASENKVLCSFNEYVERCSEDVVILLNNDMELAPSFVDPLMEPFLKDEDVFFVATNEDRSIAKIHYGLLTADMYYQGHEALNQKEGFTLSAGVAAFNRKKFLELGGYDEIFLPGRYEDVDLCYRGWKRGWKGIYQPLSKKMHLGGASFEKVFAHNATQALVFRNAIFFMVKNITDRHIFARFLFWLPVRLVGSIFVGKLFFWQGFLQAIPKLPGALKRRREVKGTFVQSDQWVIDTVNDAWYSLCRSERTRPR